MLVDTHAHLYDKKVFVSIDETVGVFRINNISKVLLPGVDIDDNAAIIDLTNRYGGIFYPMIGVHPGNVLFDYERQLSEICMYLGEYKYIALGEIGLDYYRRHENINEQKLFFDKILDVSIECNLPVSLHCRNAFDDMYSILKNKKGLVSGVVHCFTGSLEQARKYADLGLYFGIGGIVTFKNSGLCDVVKNIGINNIVLETDSPYLSPEPVRGTVNSSINLKYIVKKLSDIFEITEQDVEEKTTLNAEKIFNTKCF